MRYVFRFLYAISLIVAGAISWFYNRSFFMLILHLIIAPFYIIYKVAVGDLDDGYWRVLVGYYW